MSDAAHDVRPTTESVTSLLAGLDDHDRETLELRLERWSDDLVAALMVLYPEHDVSALALRLVESAVAGYRQRSSELRRLDQRRLLRPDWLQQPDMFGYAGYTDRFAGTLDGLRGRVGYLRDLGVSYLHLMPLLQPRDGDNDGGYAVQDYRTIRSDLGDVEDLGRLASHLRGQGISLVLDLVLNHVAREHEWARRARAGESHYRDYFHVYADLVLYLANLGVEVLRLDAIAFTWKRLGTSCQNQPEVHAVTQALRTVARIACPALAFKAEAIVGPRDLVQYLGQGEHAGRVSDLAYHNSLMVQVWSMLATGSTGLTKQALSALPTTPPSGTWICYVRCHDDIGWAIDDGDAASAGLDGYAHRRFLSNWYSGDHPGSWAHGLVFQHNAATGDKRISGTAAALTGLSDAEERGDEEGVGAGLARLFLAHAVVAGWGGIPVVWSGDELGLPNDPDWAREPGHEDDNRWAHRERLDWAVAARRGDLDTVSGKVFQGLRHLAGVRAGLPQLHASAQTRVILETDDGVLAVVRTHPSGSMVCVYNVTTSWQTVEVRHFADVGIAHPFDALAGYPVFGGADGLASLSPYAAWWIVEAPVDVAHA